MIRSMLQDKHFFRVLTAIGIPVAIQHVITSSLNLVDVVMIGQINAVSITAVGLANQLFFVFSLLLFGINSGGAIFVAQFWGRRDLENIHKSLGVALLLSVAGGLMFTVISVLFPEWFMRLLSNDDEAIRLGVEYLRIVGLSYLATAVSITLSSASRSVGDARLPMRASILSLGVNTGLNAVLIFGLLGFPAMGVKGAALATLVARGLECLILTVTIFTSLHPLRAKGHQYFRFSRAFARRILQKSFPVMANEFLWAIGMTLYVAAYARMGTQAYAAVQISQTVEKLFFVAAMGIGHAAAVMIGNLLGENRREEAIRYSRYFNLLTIFFGIVLAVFLLVTAPAIARFFNVDEQVRADAVKVMAVFAFFLTIKMCNALQVIGTLRGGGDTTYSLMMEISSVYLVGVPMAFLATTYWQLPIYVVVALVHLEEVTKAIVGFRRLFSNKWASNIIEGM
ncbi:MATE family efflux transporter [Anoxynatronum buryatiense]|uniref:Probable multidrug resistance protein NorM n=1 Tax=Anoxynatronum buryatiense TaxID=489973 RepID=A0AA45WUI7_9CLOT|nr:MATE family efflux transporter [Anoxynatronum buryatiense]SMP44151.1 putative efflux protein, MATE family [Anoxynatronum buryatiense]